MQQHPLPMIDDAPRFRGAGGGCSLRAERRGIVVMTAIARGSRMAVVPDRGTIARHERTSPLPASAWRRATAAVGSSPGDSAVPRAGVRRRDARSGRSGCGLGGAVLGPRPPDSRPGRIGLPFRRECPDHRGPTTRRRSSTRSSKARTRARRSPRAAATVRARSMPRCSSRWRRSCCSNCCFRSGLRSAFEFSQAVLPVCDRCSTIVRRPALLLCSAERSRAAARAFDMREPSCRSSDTT